MKTLIEHFNQLRQKYTRNPPVQENESKDTWQQHVETLKTQGIAEPGSVLNDKKHAAATLSDEAKLYTVEPSFVDLLPWVEFLPQSQTMLLDDGQSVAAFYELLPVGTEGREASWLKKVRDALENALQDSFDEEETNPWVIQLYAQDETGWENYLSTLKNYVRDRAKGSAFTEAYLRLFEQHLYAVAKPGGLFDDNTVTKLPWRGQSRRVRLVVYRRVKNVSKHEMPPEQTLNMMCERLTGGLQNAGIKAKRLGAADIHDWLIRWFNPNPTMLGDSQMDKERFYQLVSYPGNGNNGDGEDRQVDAQVDKQVNEQINAAGVGLNDGMEGGVEGSPEGDVELASGLDFAQRLFFNKPRSDVQQGFWYFDHLPHRVLVLDRLRAAPVIGHLTGETRKGGDAINSLFDQMPEDTTLCITMVVTPQDTLEAHLNYLAKKSVGETLASEQTRSDVEDARKLIGSSHKLYRASLVFYLRGNSAKELQARELALCNVALGAGLQPVREEDEVAPLNSYLRWLPCVYDPAKDKKQWYTQLMFAQHVANIAPVWGRSQGTGHPGITFFNRGGGTVTFDPLNRLDRQMNAHLFLFGPTGSGKSATLTNIISQVTAIYRPRLFIVEAGNSFGLFGDLARRQGLTVHKVRLSPGSGVSLSPFGDAIRLIETPGKVKTLDVDALDDDTSQNPINDQHRELINEQQDEQRDILGELEITARMMITGGEDKEEARMTRADRSMIRQCIIDAAVLCERHDRMVLTQDVRDAFYRRAKDQLLPEARRNRLQEMADAMDMFCQGVDGEMFNRPGTPWPEADITIVDLATFAREGYNAQLSIAYISLINTINNIAERDQFLGRPIISVTDEGHIITKNPLLSPYIVKITKMWRKLGAWFWLATQNLDDLPKAAEPMLNMIEWWICLNMPPDEVEKIARFRELNEAQKALMLSARKESGKFTEGVVLSKSMEVLFRAVPPSLYLALAMTEPEEKNERYQLMQKHGISELDAAILVAEKMDKHRGIA